MDLTEDSFRALARSSPWLFRSLHFVAHRPYAVEAWLERPSRLTVRGESGDVHEVRDDDEQPQAVVFAVSDELPASYADAEVRRQLDLITRPNVERPVTLRSDGLVAERPTEWDAHGSDPMWTDYFWVAMLDPFELSHGTSVGNLRHDVHHGRRVWRARVAPTSAYEPCCSCCPLLPSVVADRLEDPDAPERPAGYYPEAFEVALDVQTGVVVALDTVGGRVPDASVDVEILEVEPV